MTPLFISVLLAAMCLECRAQKDNVLQPKGDETATEGEAVTLGCQYNSSSSNPNLFWYKQDGNNSPKFILSRFKIGTGKTEFKERFSSTLDSTSRSVPLKIQKLQLSDSAVYYCALQRWDWLVFGKPIRLTVEPKDPSPVEPALFVLSPLQPEGVSVKQLADEVCLATGFHPKEGDMVLNVKERQVTTNTSNSVMSQKDKTYYYAGFINETIYSCELHNTLANNEMVDLCADLHPEKAKLNFFLLVMNGVRLVFTKVLAFSTIFTIRAVLF